MFYFSVFKSFLPIPTSAPTNTIENFSSRSFISFKPLTPTSDPNRISCEKLLGRQVVRMEITSGESLVDPTAKFFKLTPQELYDRQ